MPQHRRPRRPAQNMPVTSASSWGKGSSKAPQTKHAATWACAHLVGNIHHQIVTLVPVTVLQPREASKKVTPTRPQSERKPLLGSTIWNPNPGQSPKGMLWSLCPAPQPCPEPTGSLTHTCPITELLSPLQLVSLEPNGSFQPALYPLSWTRLGSLYHGRCCVCVCEGGGG